MSSVTMYGWPASLTPWSMTATAWRLLMRAAAFASADALVFPSTNETFGLVALEAMACGLPVVASQTGGLVDVLQDGANGLAFDPADPHSLAERVRRLQAAPELRARLGAGALAHARGRDWRATMDQLIDYYELAMRVWRRRLAIRD